MNFTDNSHLNVFCLSLLKEDNIKLTFKLKLTWKLLV